MTQRTLNPSDIPVGSGDDAIPLVWVREQLRAELATGDIIGCPCCGQTAKVYSRSINATIARSLRLIAESSTGLTNRDIISATRQSGGGNISLLQFWGLVTQDDKRWKITSSGRQWLYGYIAIPSRVLIYNNQFLGFDERKKVRFVDVTGYEFSLTDVLDPRAVETAQMEGVSL